MNRRWLGLLVLFVASVGIAIASTHLFAFQFNPNYSNGYQANSSTSGNLSPVAFPAEYRQQFVQYATVDCSNSRIVRKMYINRESLEAIASNRADPNPTVPDNTVIVMETHAARVEGDRLIPTQLSNLFIREKQHGWNADPDSGEWQSAWYSPSGSLVSADQSSCIGCHTRVRDRDYTFTLPALLTAAQTGQRQTQETEFGTSVCR